MDENIHESLRKAQLYIAKEIRRICEKHNIHYFLDCGSMLGAVRHKGFIPWDDDMDIGMVKADYDKFLMVAPDELGEDFFLDNYDSNDDCALVFSKVRLKGTEYLEDKGDENRIHNEIFVDVFPYYWISDNEIERKIEGAMMAIFSQAILSKCGYKVWKGDGFIKRVKFIPTDVIGFFLSKRKMFAIINNLYNKHSSTKRMCIHAGSCYGYWFFDKDVFDDFVDAEFEGDMFKIPSRYDDYLKQAYGNYMELPPIEKRITHNIKKLDLGKYEGFAYFDRG